ncbi:MAG: hypothetical protein EOO27_32545 [Comamonadaceae bacterium]|nr:MAG: hypothetical protein EOO27_32545 [Comamonadaceae bacterium]
MKSVTNIYFKKNGQTRYVKHGFSWQLAFFGPLAFLMRGQWPLALACIGFIAACFLAVGLTISIIWDPESEVLLELVALVVPWALMGQYGNRISARSYIKNGWFPVAAFPLEWNIPPILPTAAAVAAGAAAQDGQPHSTQRASL